MFSASFKMNEAATGIADEHTMCRFRGLIIHTRQKKSTARARLLTDFSTPSHEDAKAPRTDKKNGKERLGATDASMIHPCEVR
jgi:hypothetical protein